MGKSRDSFIFYRSFYEAIKPLQESDKAKIFDAICEFSLDNKDVNLEGVTLGFFTLIKPQLEANRKRFESGSKAKRKQTGSKPEANQKQSASKPEANKNVNVNDNLNNLDAFNRFRELYGGKKRGNETEFANFVKKHKDWKDVLPLLKPSIERQIAAREIETGRGDFVPAWKDLATWINNRCWELVIDVTRTPKQPTEEELKAVENYHEVPPVENAPYRNS